MIINLSMNICTKCNTGFKTKQHLFNHLNRKTPCIKEIIKCNNCLKEFNRNEHLINHNNRKKKCIKIDLEKRNLELENTIKLFYSIINNYSIVVNEFYCFYSHQ